MLILNWLESEVGIIMINFFCMIKESVKEEEKYDWTVRMKKLIFLKTVKHKSGKVQNICQWHKSCFEHGSILE